MKYIVLFEKYNYISLTRSMLDEKDKSSKEITEKYTDIVRDYLHEITDKFTPVKFELGPSSIFNVWFKVDITDINEFFESFHEDIFDRIRIDYPNSSTKFKIGLKRKSMEAYPWTYFSGSGELVECNDKDIQMVYNYIKGENDSFTYYSSENYYSHFIIVLFIS